MFLNVFSKMSHLMQVLLAITISSEEKDFASRVGGSHSVHPSYWEPWSRAPVGCSGQEQLCCGHSSATVHPPCHKQNLVEREVVEVNYIFFLMILIAHGCEER